MKSIPRATPHEHSDRGTQELASEDSPRRKLGTLNGRLQMAIRVVKIPRNCVVPTITNFSDHSIQLYNVFVVPSSKLHRRNTHDSTVVIRYCFKCQSRIALFSFAAIVVPCRAVTPLHMHDVHGSTSSRQFLCSIGLHDFSEFSRGAWQGDVLVLDTAHLRQEIVKKIW